jgi:hypothetical protein
MQQLIIVIGIEREPLSRVGHHYITLDGRSPKSFGNAYLFSQADNQSESLNVNGLLEIEGAQTMTTDQQSNQLSFYQAEYGSKKKLTRRDKFLAEMESVVPWERLIAVIEPYYPKSGKRGRPRLD